MSLRTVLGAFPDLDPALVQITSPIAPAYNCIAYAVGDLRRWWWPDPDRTCYWPPNVLRAVHLSAFQQAFESLGFRLTADKSAEPEYEKLAMFAKQAIPTHAARQLRNGLWSSKLGSREDISHNLEGLECAKYGKVAFLMRRSR